MGKICDYKDFCLKALDRTCSMRWPEFKHKTACLNGLISQITGFGEAIQEREKLPRLFKNAYKI